jgi:hypothetical protein
MSSPNSPRKVVPTLLMVCTVGWFSDVRAQAPVDCGARVETLLKQALSLLQPGAGTGAKRPDGQGRLYQYFAEKCIEESRCGGLDLQLSLFEASLDDAMWALQRQKLARFKAVMADVKASGSEACAAIPKLESLSTELKVFNDQQLTRLDQLAPNLFAEPVGNIR